MTTSTKSRKGVKPVRTARLARPVENGRGAVAITVGSEATVYDLAAVAVDYGEGFKLTKPDGEVYHVHLDDASGNTCDCWSHIRWGHQRPCKHVAALLALRQRDRL
jgi:hypothetical protein